jgi:hypothetical protein
MTDRVRITFDESIQSMMSAKELIKLAESIHAFIDIGAIDCENDEEILVDQDYITDLIAGIERVKLANKKYGRDDDGFVKYPFGVK